MNEQLDLPLAQPPAEATPEKPPTQRVVVPGTDVFRGMGDTSDGR